MTSPKPPVIAAHPLRWLPVVSGLLFVISPWVNALHLMRQNGNPTDYPGWPLLFFGWIGIFSILDGRFHAVGWLANPCYGISALMIVMGERTAACWVAGAAAMFSLTGFLLTEILMDEGGQTATVVGHDIGFWIWMAAIWLNLLTALLVCFVTVDTRSKGDHPAKASPETTNYGVV